MYLTITEMAVVVPKVKIIQLGPLAYCWKAVRIKLELDAARWGHSKMCFNSI